MKKLILVVTLILIQLNVSAQWNVSNPSGFQGDTTYHPNFYFITAQTGFCITGRNANAEGSFRHNALYKTIDGAVSWTRILSVPASSNWKGIDGIGEDSLFVSLGIGGIGGRVVRSYNGGQSWDTILNNDAIPFCFPTGRVVFAGNNSVWVSENFGNSPIKVHDSSGLFFKMLTPDSGYYYQYLDKKLYRTVDGGYSWSACKPVPGNHFEFNYYYASPTVLFGMVDNKLYKSIDAGESWTLKKSFFKSISSERDGIYFLNENVGFYTFSDSLFKTNNGGETWCWQNFNQGQSTLLSEYWPMYAVNDSQIFWVPFGGLAALYIANTNNQGGPACPSSPGTGMEETKVSNGLRVYPNPSAGQFRLSLESGNLKQLEVYSASGQLILTKTLQGQTGEFSLKSTPGLYLLRVLDDQGIWRQQKVLVN